MFERSILIFVTIVSILILPFVIIFGIMKIVQLFWGRNY